MKNWVARTMLWYLWGVLCLYTVSSHAQNEISFSRLTDGYTNCILKDSEGFIWVGTQDGIIRYDHVDFKKIRHENDDPFSIGNNWIWTIIEDENKNLWLGTFGGGLIKWDRSLDRYYSISNNLSTEGSDIKFSSVHSLYQMNDSILLVGTEGGMFKFNKENEKYLSQFPCEEGACFINDLYASDDKSIYLGTQSGLYLLTSENSIPSKIQYPMNEGISVYSITGIKHRIYFGTDDGLYVYNQRKKSLENHFSAFNQDDATVFDILLLNNEEWYLGTNRGIAHFKDGFYSWNTEDQDDKDALYSGFIHCISNVGSNIAWAGTRKGVHQFSAIPSEFRSLGTLMSFKGCSSTILGMTEDHKGDLWIGTRSGILYLDYEENLNEWGLDCLHPSTVPEMKDAYVINITRDNQDNLWIAYRNRGISRITLGQNKLIWNGFPNIENFLEGEGVNQVFQDSDGLYWLATRGKGLMSFDPNNENVTIFDENQGLSHPYVFRIYEDHTGHLWLSTANGGLCRFDKENQQFRCFQTERNNPDSLSSQMVLSVNELSDDRLLVSTTSGLNILNDNGTFQHINTLDGLTNNVIYGALEDDNGDIWVSTNEGLSRISLYDPSTQVTNYDKSQGLSSKEFNQHSFLEHSSGLFFFGGIDGLTFFNPLKIAYQKIEPNLIFTDFKLFNTSVPIDPESSAEFSLPQSINQLSEITLPYNKNSIEIEYRNLDFTETSLYSHIYKLEGLEGDWNRVGSRNFATYPQLPPGNYTFIVHLENNSGELIQPGKSLRIIVEKPPWKSWWAMTLYAIIFIAIIYGIIHFQTQKTKAIANARENERNIFRKKMARDFHDEAGNRITMISLLAETASRKTKSKTVNSILDQLQDNTQDLRVGMQDFIWVLDPTKDNLYDVLLRFKDFAYQSFEHTKINFVMDQIYPGMMDTEMTGNVRRHFLLIFKEAITNIIKYSECSLVEFGILKKANGWEFTLKDNGVGFDINQLNRINGLENIKSRAQKINSDVTIESKIGVGTKVLLKWHPPENL